MKLINCLKTLLVVIVIGLGGLWTFVNRLNVEYGSLGGLIVLLPTFLVLSVLRRVSLYRARVLPLRFTQVLVVLGVLSGFHLGLQIRIGCRGEPGI